MRRSRVAVSLSAWGDPSKAASKETQHATFAVMWAGLGTGWLVGERVLIDNG